MIADSTAMWHTDAMPELPEVETVARGLEPLLVGRRVRGADALDPKLDQDDLSRLVGYRTVRVFRSGKQVIVELKRSRSPRGSLFLAVHLRMTGMLTVLDGRAPDPPH